MDSKTSVGQLAPCEFCGRTDFKSPQSRNGHRSICKRTRGGSAARPESPGKAVPDVQGPVAPPTPPKQLEKIQVQPVQQEPLKLEPIPNLGAGAGTTTPPQPEVDFSKIFQVLIDKYNEALTAEPGQATIDKFKLTETDARGMGAALQALDAKYGFMTGAGQYVPEILAASVFIPIGIKMFMGLRFKRAMNLRPGEPYTTNTARPADDEREAQEAYDTYWGKR